MGKKTTKKSKKKKKKKSTIGKDLYMRWYRMMQQIRVFEMRAQQAYMQQKIRGFLHLYNDQEAVAAGVATAAQEDDTVITAYRDHGMALACGLTPKECMAELYGRKTGCSKGKGGSMHFFSKEHNFYGGHAIVGGGIPLGAGIAFAENYRGNDNVCIDMFGDGAVRQGVFHETFNLAMLFDLPVLFICENNGYAMGTSTERQSNVTDLSQLACAYDMPSESVDGMSCEDVYHSMERGLEHARNEGPYFIEMRTYRYQGHSISDPAKYRTKEEEEKYKKHDPIGRVHKTIVENDYATKEELEEINKATKKEIKEAQKYADESPYPDEEELYTDIYTQSDYPFIKD